jgi:hypothetical protein
MLGIAFAMTWIVGKTKWDAIDPDEPRKALAREVFTTTRTELIQLSHKVRRKPETKSQLAPDNE